VSGIQWEDMPPSQEPSLPECTVTPEGHDWRLTVSEGQIGLTSGCEQCDDIATMVGGEDIYMAGTITGKMVWEPDHPNLGGWHGFDRCDCGWQWRFEPERIEEDS
jgi:hypothetical protein